MDLSRREFRAELRDQLTHLQALRQGEPPRVGLVGWEPDLMIWLMAEHLLDGLDYVIYQPGLAPGDGGQGSGRWSPLEALDRDQPDLVILPRRNALRTFEALAGQFRIPPARILMDPQNWRNRDYTPDETVWRLFNQVPAGLPGALPSFEACAQLHDAMKYVFDRDIPGDLVLLAVQGSWPACFMGLVRDHYGQGRRDLLDWGLAGQDGAGQDRTSGQPPDPAGADRQAKALLADRTVALALIDLDDYAATRAWVEALYPRLPPGGILQHAHYTYESCGHAGNWGQRKAMQEFLLQQPMFNLTGTSVFLKYS